MGQLAKTVAVLPDGKTVQVTTTDTTVEQKPLDDYKAELAERLAQLTANRDSYDPLIAQTQADLDALT